MKNFKIAAIVMAAALLVIGASMTAYAGWNNLGNGDWTYTNSDGDLVTSTWKKSGTQWFYLDDEGYMARDTMIEGDEKKYVDENGAMIVNNWKWYQGEDDDEGFYYYFGSNGVAVKSRKKDIDGKSYIFNDAGQMQYGWVKEDYTMVDDTDPYPYKSAKWYCGDADDGAVVKATWLEVECDEEDTATSTTAWVRFDNKGEKVTQTAVEGAEDKKINGKYYHFNNEGKMTTGWSLDKKFYYGGSDDGSRKTGWFWAKSNRTDETEEDNNEKYHWYYGTKDGVVTSEIKKINGKYYGFDADGIMISGFYQLKIANDNKLTIVGGDADYKAVVKTTIDFNKATASNTEGCENFYFFGAEETDGAMKTGTFDVTLTDDDATTYTMTFNAKTDITDTKGQAYTGLRDKGKALYIRGVKVKASAEDKVWLYELKTGEYSRIKAKDELLGCDTFDDDEKKALGLSTSKSYKGVIYADIDINTKVGSNIFAITNSGTIVSGTTVKTDGDDYKIKVVDGQVKAIYYEV